MKTTKIIVLAACALFVGGLREQFSTANGAEGAAGYHHGAFTRKADAATTNRHLLYKQGSDSLHVALCGATDYPLGSSTDMPEAAEDIININPLTGPGTRELRCASAINANTDLYTAANGMVSATGGTGKYYVGRSVADAVQVASSDYLIEVAVRAPVVQ